MPKERVETRYSFNDYILYTYVKGNSIPFVYNMYDELDSAKSRAKRYFNTLNARAIILYDADYNIVWKEGDC